jgi:hypothetical protein
MRGISKTMSGVKAVGTQANEMRLIHTERERIINIYQTDLERQAALALRKGSVSQELYKELVESRCHSVTAAGIAAHFMGQFRKIILSEQEWLFGRMLKGAEMIDSTAKDDPRRPDMVQLYDALETKYKTSLNWSVNLDEDSEL